MSSSENNMDVSRNDFKPIQPATNDIENQIKNIKTPTVIRKKSEPKEDKCFCCKCMAIFLGVILLIGFVFGILVLYGFNIYSLTLISNKTIHNHCKNSNIWEWMISFMVISLALGTGSNKKSEDGTMQVILNNLCQLIILTGMTCWGCYEIWGVDCVDKTLLLYTLSQVTVGIYITILGIFLIGISIGCCYMIAESNCMKNSVRNM